MHEYYNHFRKQLFPEKFNLLVGELNSKPRYLPVQNNGSQKRQVPDTVQVITRCCIKNNKGEVVSRGFAFCSDKDQFSKKLGRNIALGRALKNMNLAEA